MRHLTLTLLTTLVALTAMAQPVLEGYYSFDTGDASESRGIMAFDGVVGGAPELSCGVEGNALLLDGVTDFVSFPGPINDNLTRNNFVLSLNFHPTGVSPRQTLLRKADDCDQENPRFTITYLPGENALELMFGTTATTFLGGPNNLIALDENRCWQHIVVERNARELRIYLNGERVRRFQSATRLNISNNFNLELGRTSCPGSASNFQGFIDEFRLYRGAISVEEIEELFVEPDRIREVPFPVINLGATTTLTVEQTCANSFTWEPSNSIESGLNTFEVVVQPTQSTLYEVELGYPNSGCRSTDSVLIQVFDPDEFDCTQLFVPSAFTPDANGPEQNNRLGISNAATLQRFDSFEVYDRWGNRVFGTATSTDTWDGTYAGEPAMPGVYLWRVAYGCGDEDLDKTGSVVLMR